MTLSLFDTDEIRALGATLPANETITQRIPQPLGAGRRRRPDVDESQEIPTVIPQSIGVVNPAETLRFAAPSLTVRPKPERPEDYRGRHRWTWRVRLGRAWSAWSLRGGIGGAR